MSEQFIIEILKISIPIFLTFVGIIWGIIKLATTKLLKDIKYSILRIDNKVDKLDEKIDDQSKELNNKIDIMKDNIYNIDKETAILKRDVKELKQQEQRLFYDKSTIMKELSDIKKKCKVLCKIDN